MPLTNGTRLGPYEIVSPLGAGGMGEVYKAKDTRLGRTVAIKVLPSEVSDDPERRQRFEREARAVASLSHPHICTLYDVGQHEGIGFLVMEHLEGETLAERLKNGTIPLGEALRYGIETADALDKAHRQGLVHRDLKPGNIMVTRSGAKLLDFGLAKLAGKPDEPAAPVSSAPTVRKPLTEKGALLGTFQYMAPEQIEGGETDTRTDIFALGLVLYEMTTGRKAFEAPSRASLLAAILEREPARMSLLQSMTPPALEHAVRTCLAKDPEKRWQSAADLRRELEWIAGAGGNLVEAGTSLPRAKSGLFWKIASVPFAVLATLALVIVLHRRNLPEAVVTRFSLFPPEGATFTATAASVPTVNLALSPDRRRLAFVAAASGEPPLLWVRPLDSVAARRLVGTEDASYPFWSPDGKRLLFQSDRDGFIHLYQTAAGGGGREELLFKSDNNKLPSDWSADGRVIVFHTPPASNTGWDLWSLRVDGLVAKAFLETSFNEYQGRLSSDGRFIAYASDESGRPEVYVRPFPEGAAKWRISTGGGSEPVWRRDAKELFYLAADGKLMSVEVKTGTAPFEAPRPLFQTRLATSSTAYRTSYVVRGDGQRFLVNTVVGEVKSAPITVVLNWARELGKQ